MHGVSWHQSRRGAREDKARLGWDRAVFIFGEKRYKNGPPGRDRCTESHGTRAAGEPEGARPASDGIGQYFYAEHKNTAPG